MTPEKAFGSILRQLRTEKNFSQERLALDSGLDRTFISLLERGLRQPSLSTLLQLSNVLHIKASDVITKVETLLMNDFKKNKK
jgi:transcriptional regulator with XRE-family HTH domain